MIHLIHKEEGSIFWAFWLIGDTDLKMDDIKEELETTADVKFRRSRFKVMLTNVERFLSHEFDQDAEIKELRQKESYSSLKNMLKWGVNRYENDNNLLEFCETLLKMDPAMKILSLRDYRQELSYKLIMSTCKNQIEYERRYNNSI